MWTYNLENYSYIALAFGQRQVLLSVLGFIVMLAVTGFWRRRSVRSLLPAWLWFWVWMLPLSLLGSTNPGVGIFNGVLHMLRAVAQRWLPLQARSPCEVPYLDRVSSDLPLLPLLSWHKLVLGLWLIFAATKAIRLLLQRKQLASIARKAAPVDEPRVLTQMAQLRQRYRLSRTVSLRSSSACSQAFTVGVLRPIIFIPAYLLRELDVSDIEAVLGHELAHIKRYDDIVIRIQLITKSILFFNPLIWLSALRINSLRERRCDQLAIEVSGLSPQSYAKSLLRIAELQRHTTFANEVVPGLISSALAERVAAALTAQDKRFSCLPLLAVMAGLLSLNMIFMPNLSDTNSVRGGDARTLLHRIGAVAPLPRLLGDGNFIDNAGNRCGLPQREHYHPGADFVPGADGDARVRAIADGEVIMVNAIPQVGTTLQIKHANEMISTYVHLRDASVKAGEHVRAGDYVGSVDDSHLHLEVREDSRVVDPSVLLKNPNH